MTPEARGLWRTLPGQCLLRLMIEGRAEREAREKFRWLLDLLRARPGIRVMREPRQLSIFYCDPPLVDQPWPCAVERFEAGFDRPATLNRMT